MLLYQTAEIPPLPGHNLPPLYLVCERLSHTIMIIYTYIHLTCDNFCSPCVPCGAGLYRSASASRCLACARGTFAPQPASFNCSACAPGSYSDAEGSVRCAACPPGMHASQRGATECNQCGPRSYAPVAGMSNCLPCPNRTVTKSMHSTLIHDCECEGGSYHPAARTGEPCEECPVGMYCQGNVLPPVTKTAFWSEPEMYPAPDTVLAVKCNYRNVRGVCIGYPSVQNQTLLQLCLYHPQQGRCGSATWPNLTGLPSDTRGGRSDYIYGGSLRSAAWDTGVDADTFLGRVHNKSRLYRDDKYCKAGYQGRLCSECADLYYRVLDGTCDKCPWWGFFASYLALFAAWGVAAALLCLASMGQSHFARLLISVAQSIHIISRFSINWPPFPMYVLRTFAIFNFSLEMLPWTCYGIRMAWIDMWFLSLVMPYLITGACVVQHLLPYLVTTELYFHARRKANEFKARFDDWFDNLDSEHSLQRLRRLCLKASAFFNKVFGNPELKTDVDGPQHARTGATPPPTMSSRTSRTTRASMTAPHTSTPAAPPSAASRPANNRKKCTTTGVAFGRNGSPIPPAAASAKGDEKRREGGGREEGARDISRTSAREMDEDGCSQTQAQTQAPTRKSGVPMSWLSKFKTFAFASRRVSASLCGAKTSSDGVGLEAGAGRVGRTNVEEHTRSACGLHTVETGRVLSRDERRMGKRVGEDVDRDGWRGQGQLRNDAELIGRSETDVLVFDFDSEEEAEEEWKRKRGGYEQTGRSDDDEEEDANKRDPAGPSEEEEEGGDRPDKVSKVHGTVRIVASRGEGGGEKLRRSDMEESQMPAASDSSYTSPLASASSRARTGTSTARSASTTKGTRKNKRVKTAASLQASALRAACVDAAMRHSMARSCALTSFLRLI
jgi:hypothetical protein